MKQKFNTWSVFFKILFFRKRKYKKMWSESRNGFSSTFEARNKHATATAFSKEKARDKEKRVSVEAVNDKREKRSSIKWVLQIEHASRKNGKHRTGGRTCRLSKILSNFWCRIRPLLLSCPSGCPLWDLVCCFQPTKTDKVKILEHSVCEGYFTSIYLRDLS